MKSERVYQFLVVLLLILPAKIFSQQQMPRIGQISPHLISTIENFSLEKFPNISYLIISQKQINVLPQPAANPRLVRTIPSNLSVCNLPFFCNQEFHFEKTTSIPLRVRLGSLDYVNRLEGK